MKRSTLSLLVAAVISTTSLNVNAQNNWQDSAKDAWIDGKAESTILFSTHLNSFDINTDVKNGVVTLTGKVETEVDKALAEELMLSLDGVQNVNNALTVLSKSDINNDSEIVQKLKDSKVETVVKTRLLFESEVDGLDINVEATNGVVTLEGKVDSEAQRKLAITIAKNTNDVEEVVNKLELVANS
ncbi:BON domain-containing protein [Paraglaciecola aquimarina]|uniref:BON domain-containing protein n=1 Tax=Paraglaciecola algarum TaxID=3050085 RepID=A0ABS9D4K3_9ALTE|nr:BON domain-containing protein [Paraglaciecola sp. G1-23]MCF2947840.1 BON domain-containing protein [Paraglaciecola sp. G1-23]